MNAPWRGSQRGPPLAEHGSISLRHDGSPVDGLDARGVELSLSGVPAVLTVVIRRLKAGVHASTALVGVRRVVCDGLRAARQKRQEKREKQVAHSRPRFAPSVIASPERRSTRETEPKRNFSRRLQLIPSMARNATYEPRSPRAGQSLMSYPCNRGHGLACPEASLRLALAAIHCRSGMRRSREAGRALKVRPISYFCTASHRMTRDDESR
jgi:hypothetical protein